jgi:hypothetical protein
MLLEVEVCVVDPAGIGEPEQGGGEPLTRAGHLMQPAADPGTKIVQRGSRSTDGLVEQRAPADVHVAVLRLRAEERSVDWGQTLMHRLLVSSVRRPWPTAGGAHVRWLARTGANCSERTFAPQPSSAGRSAEQVVVPPAEHHPRGVNFRPAPGGQVSTGLDRKPKNTVSTIRLRIRASGRPRFHLALPLRMRRHSASRSRRPLLVCARGAGVVSSPS